jgi:hypothetical protein
MSASSDLVSLVKVKDSVLDIREKILFPVISGPAQLSTQSISANTASASNLSFQVQTPNESTVIGRNVLLDIVYDVQFTYQTGGTPGAVFSLGTSEAPCPIPFQNGFAENVQCYLNNSSISSPLGDIFNERYLSTLNVEEYAKHEGICPYMPDNYLNYADAVAGNNNPLSAYGSSSYNLAMGRGNYEVISTGVAVGDTTLTTAGPQVCVNTVRFRSVEPIMLKPFMFDSGAGQDEGLIGINSFTLTYNLNSSSKRFWSSNLSPAFTAVGVVTVLKRIESAKLLIPYRTLSEFDRLPLRNTIPGEELTRYITPAVTVANGAVASLISNNIQLGGIPSRIYIAARVPQSDRLSTDSFSYFGVGSDTPLQITFDNKSNLLSNFNNDQLFQMSLKNGYNRGADSFRGFATKAFAGGGAAVQANLSQVFTSGPCYIINPSLNLSLDSRLSNGCTANVNMQVRLSVKNNLAVPKNCELVIITQFDSAISTVSGSTYINSVLMDSRDVVNVKSSKGGCTTNELERIMGRDSSQSFSDALATLGCDKGMKGSAVSGGSQSGSARSGGKSKSSDLDSLLF